MSQEENNCMATAQLESPTIHFLFTAQGLMNLSVLFIAQSTLESLKPLLDDYFDMEQRELLLPDLGDKFRTTTFQDYVLSQGVGK